jgi:hypothetical protein
MKTSSDKAYIVKYWDTDRGVYDAAVEIEDGCVRDINEPNQLVRDWLVIGVDAALSKEAAESLVRMKVTNKIAKLEAEIRRLETVRSNVRKLWR